MSKRFIKALARAEEPVIVGVSKGVDSVSLSAFRCTASGLTVLTNDSAKPFSPFTEESFLTKVTAKTTELNKKELSQLVTISSCANCGTSFKTTSALAHQLVDCEESFKCVVCSEDSPISVDEEELENSDSNEEDEGSEEDLENADEMEELEDSEDSEESETDEEEEIEHNNDSEEEFEEESTVNLKLKDLKKIVFDLFDYIDAMYINKCIIPLILSHPSNDGSMEKYLDKYWDSIETTDYELKNCINIYSKIIENGLKNNNDFILLYRLITENPKFNPSIKKYFDNKVGSDYEQSLLTKKAKAKANLEEENEEDNFEEENEEETTDPEENTIEETQVESGKNCQLSYNLLASVIKSNSSKIQLSAVANATGTDLNYYLFIDKKPVAVSKYELCATNLKGLYTDPNQFVKAFYAALSTELSDENVKDFGLEPISVQIDVDDATNQQIKEATDKAKEDLTKEISTVSAKYKQCVSIASVGITKGFFAEITHAVKASLYEKFTTAGVENADEIIDDAFEEAGEDYQKSVLQKANELFDESDEVRNTTAKFVESCPYKKVSKTVASKVSERLAQNSINFSTIDARPEAYTNTSSTKQTPKEFNNLLKFNI